MNGGDEIRAFAMVAEVWAQLLMRGGDEARL